MRLRPLSVAAAFVLLLALAWTAYWSTAAARLKSWVEDWAVAERARGATVDYADLAFSGFPLELRLSAGAVRVRRPDGLAFSAARLAASAEPWNPLDIAFRLEGEPAVALPAAGARPALALAASAGAGRAQMAPDGSVRALALTLANPAAGVMGTDALLTATALDLALDWPATPPATHTDPGLFAGLALRDLALPGQPVMGATVQRADLRLTVKGAPPADFGRTAVAAWSGDGGTVELVVDAIDWGDLRLSGDATLALDGALQPVASGTTTLIGFEYLFDRLAAIGRLQRSQATMAKTALGLLAKPTADGALALTVPVTLQDRRLTLGPFPIAEVPPIRWD